MKTKILGLLVTIASIALISPANAADYKSSNATTFITLIEYESSIFPNAKPNTGQYFTTLNGQRFNGDIKITTVNSGTNGNKVYTGTFADLNRESRCKGTIKINKSLAFSANRQAPYGVILTEWTVGTGGFKCPSPVGTKYTVSLRENLPTADSRGEYPGNPGSGSASSDYAWNHPFWRVTDRTNLSCRQSPNGRVVKTIPFGASFYTQVQGINQFKYEPSTNKRWIYSTTDRCYVRATPAYIAPNPQAY